MHQQGVCPVCDSKNINYGAMEVDGEGVCYPAQCEDCGATFHECYDLVFAGHYNIKEA